MSKQYDLTDVENPRDLKNLMEKYGISCSVLGKRAGYSQATVYGMMNNQRNTHSENYMIIRRALLNMIEESPVDGEPYSLKCIQNIKTYLRANKIAIEEFCDMCGISHNWFYGWYLKSKSGIAPEVMAKILTTTGWTSEQVRTGKIGEDGSNEGWIKIKKSDEDILNEATVVEETEVENNPDEAAFVSMPAECAIDQVIKKNHQYSVKIDEDGTKHYICEYDLVQTTHVTRELTREQFMQEV